MHVEEIQQLCLGFKGVEESFPFDESTLVFKVGGKIFLLLDLNSNPVSFNVKCEPIIALSLREKYPFVKPGYHMNKQHWNTVTAEIGCSKKMILAWIKASYDLVLNSRANFGFLGYFNKNARSPFEGYDVGGDGLGGYTLYGRETIGLR